MKNFTLILAAVLLAGCSKPQPPSPPSPHIDEGLRAFLGIRAVDVIVTLPDSVAAYYPVAMLFADGKEVAHAKGGMHSVRGPGAVRPVTTSIQLLWQTEGSRLLRAALVEPPNACDLTAKFSAWEPGSRSIAWRRVSENERLDYKGVSIRGMVVTSGDDKHGPQLYPTSQTLPSAGKYVVAFGIVPGSNREAIEKRFFAKEL